MSTQEAHKTLSGTVSSEKHEILFARYGVNYNSLDAIFRRGSIILWEPETNQYTSLDLEAESTSVSDTTSSVGRLDVMNSYKLPAHPLSADI